MSTQERGGGVPTEGKGGTYASATDVESGQSPLLHCMQLLSMAAATMDIRWSEANLADCSWLVALFLSRRKMHKSLQKSDPSVRSLDGVVSY